MNIFLYLIKLGIDNTLRAKNKKNNKQFDGEGKKLSSQIWLVTIIIQDRFIQQLPNTYASLRTLRLALMNHREHLFVHINTSLPFKTFRIISTHFRCRYLLRQHYQVIDQENRSWG